MTDPQTCHVVSAEGGVDLGPHPLATLTGVRLFSYILVLQNRWRDLSKRQREIVVDAYMAALDAAAEGDSIPLPALPDTVRATTVAALERHGLVRDGRLTPLALEVVKYRPLPPQRAPDPPDVASTQT